MVNGNGRHGANGKRRPSAGAVPDDVLARAYVAHRFNAERAWESVGGKRSAGRGVIIKRSRKPSFQAALRDEVHGVLGPARVDAERVISEWAAIAFVDPGNLVEWGPDGITLKRSDELPAELRHAVKSVTQTVAPGGSVTTRLEFHNKSEALRGLAQYFDLLGGRGDDGDQVRMQVIQQFLTLTPEQLRQMAGGRVQEPTVED